MTDSQQRTMMRCNPFSSANESCIVALAISVVLLRILSPSCRAQATQTTLVPDAPGTSAPSSRSSDFWADQALPRGQALPAAQLVQILERNPEAMVEVKALAAASAQEQGISLEADTLTDQQVYAQIGTNDELRATVTQFLRNRGYLADQEGISVGAASGPRDADSALDGAEDAADASLGNAGTLHSRGNSENIADKMSLRQMKVQPEASGDGSGQTGAIRTVAPNITDEPRVTRRPTPYNLLSLRDLYTQIPDVPGHLSRFGSDLFVLHDLQGKPMLAPDENGASEALDVPLGPDYVLGPGDELSIHLWGGVSLNLQRVIDREGQVALPEAGLVQVAGLTMANAQTLVGNMLQQQYRNVQVSLTVARLRSIRIFVVGDVKSPGAYEVSALASPISILFLAGGPTASGSMRTLRHYRNQQLVGEIDLYDFMLHGVRASDDRLQSGDTLLIPPVGPEVAIFGAVRRPAIYELKDEHDLSSVLADAGGLTVAAELTHITIDRVVENQHREEIAVGGTPRDVPDPPPDLKAVGVKDGDRVRVGTVLPYEQRVIYLQGHVARPGRVAYRDNLEIGDVLRSYQDLLPEPARRGEIVRLVPPDLHPETIDFNVPDVIEGRSNLPLQPFDTIKVFSRYEVDAPAVSIRGEVQNPGTYPLFDGMTAAQLVRAAGGFKRDAFVDQADLASYREVDGERVSVERRNVAIGDAVLKGDHDADTPLKPGDVLTVHQVTGWNDIGASIVIKGEVAHPGSYGFTEGEHLSDVLRRAGGFRLTAYPEGAVLTRPEVAALEEKNKQELIRQIETASAAARLSPLSGSSDQGSSSQLVEKQQDHVIAELRSQPATGRLVIHINSAIESWAGTAADIEVRSGDVLRIPKRPGFVLVSGQVYNPSAITFMPRRTAGWYLQHAGGVSPLANKKQIFIIRANGDVVGRSGAWYEHDVLSTKLTAGDTIVVPQKIIGRAAVLRSLLGSAQIASSIAIAAAVAGL
jgi:protein involved in polysaccharide export with SLBB domain